MGSANIRSGPTVFISYNHADGEIAGKLTQALEAEGVDVIIDTKVMKIGNQIQSFIEESIGDVDAVISIVSKNSLQSGWVAIESMLGWQNACLNKSKKFLPCYIDDEFLKDVLSNRRYGDDATEEIQTKLNDIGKLINKRVEEDRSTEDLIPERDRLLDLKNNLGKILNRLRTSLMGDLRNDKFEETVEKILAEIGVEGSISRKRSLAEYYQKVIDELSGPEMQLDRRFVSMTIVNNQVQGTGQDRAKRYNDLRDVLADLSKDRAIVLLGEPGAGKSTLLKRLQLDATEESLKNNDGRVAYYVTLNRYMTMDGEKLPSPGKWLQEKWEEDHGTTTISLNDLIDNGRVLLLLDGLNEMPHGSPDEYNKLVGYWREFVRAIRTRNNRIIFTCRSLNYSVLLSSEQVRVPQIEVRPLTPEQIEVFLQAYLGESYHGVWRMITQGKDVDFYRTPYFLSLLCSQVDDSGEVPKGRAGLFTRYVRNALRREIERESAGDRFKGLLTADDFLDLNRDNWPTAFRLPEDGELIPGLRNLAFRMQSNISRENMLVRIDYKEAYKLLESQLAEQIINAGAAINVLNKNTSLKQITFHHQLLQEYFAAQRLAGEPDGALVRTEWRVSQIRPSLTEVIAQLGEYERLPPLDASGWEETTLMAAPMARDQEAFIRGLIDNNLVVAARCAILPEVTIPADRLKRLRGEIQQRLIERTQDMTADLRARIAAGEALGMIGDPRFEQKQGPYGEYLYPPLADIPAGLYPIGDDSGPHERERPSFRVKLEQFRIGAFPVTNAEYEKFILAGGYKDKRWWDVGGMPEHLEPEYWDNPGFSNSAQPVIGISWFEARAYCNWFSANTGEPFRLPTEFEYEAAARGTEGRRFCYGNQFDPARCNTNESRLWRITPVGVFDNRTPEGAFDLTGNVWSWTSSIFDQERFSYRAGNVPYRDDSQASGVRRLVRGGSWYIARNGARAAYRSVYPPAVRLNDLGFRVVVGLWPPSLSH